MVTLQALQGRLFCSKDTGTVVPPKPLGAPCAGHCVLRYHSVRWKQGEDAGVVLHLAPLLALVQAGLSQLFRGACRGPLHTQTHVLETGPWMARATVHGFLFLHLPHWSIFSDFPKV